MNRDVAIVGMGCRFPQAADLGAYWRNICEARVCFSEVPAERWNHGLFYDPSPRAIDKTYARKVGFVDDVRSFAALYYGLAPLRVSVMDPQHRLLLDAVRVALEDAGRGEATLAGTRTGVFVGASVSEYKDLITSRLRARALLDGQFGRAPRLPAEFADAIIEDVMPLRAFSIAGNLLNMAAATVAQTFDLRGPAFTIDAACSSSLVAAYDAVLYLRAGVCDVAVAGGVYLNLTPDNLVGFSRIGAISPSDACRPFDDRADGFVLGEGAGAVVMKRLDDALCDGDRIYAVIRGAGINNDGRGEGPMTPRPEGQLDAIERAHAEVEFSPESIGFIEAHGTATAVGDATEVGALRRYFEGHARGSIDCALSSVKANIGHTMSAAGVAGLIKAALVLDKATIPAQAGFSRAHDKLGLSGSGFHVPTATAPFPASPGQPRRAAVSSFGFGGTNCHLVLEEAPRRRVSSHAAVTATAPGPEAFFVSAPTVELLDAHLGAIHGAIGEAINDAVPLADLAATLATRAREQARVGFTARTHDELRQKLGAAREVVRGGAAPPGVWFAAAPLPEADRRIAFVFPGQGAQAIGMARALYDRFPAFRARLDALAGALDDLLARPLLTYLYPPRDGATFDEAAALRALTATEICQPAMAALGLAVAGFAEQLGVVPAVVAGHSLGEFAALGAAGVISPRDTVRFVAERGRLMSTLPLVDPGAMAAVQADRAFVEARIAGTPEVVVANVNHPKQTVISGATDAVLAASARLAGDGATVTRLAVSHAFHSPLIAPADPAIGALVGALAIDLPTRLANRPANPLAISCIEPGPYPADDAGIRRILRRHATAPVDFVAGVRALAEAGAKVIVQVAAGTTLLSMARSSLRAAEIVPVAAISLSGTSGDDAAQLLEAMAELAVLGVPVALDALPSTGARLTWLPPTPLPTESYWCATRSDRERPALPALVAGGDGRTSAPGDDVIALFREQVQILQTHADIMRTQAEVLAGTGTSLPALATLAESREAHRVVPLRAATPVLAIPAHSNGHAKNRPLELAAAPVSEPFAAPVVMPPAAPVATPPAAPVAIPLAAPVALPPASPQPLSLEPVVDVGDKLLGLVAQVSAFPRDKLVPTQRLISDLGFDSLMVVELSGKLTDAFSGFKGLPKTLFASEPTIADVITHIQHALGDAGRVRVPVANEAPRTITRYVATPVARPLAPMPHGAIPPLTGPITILADAGGVAAGLASRLTAAGVAAEIGDRLTDRTRGVIDLRALGAATRDPFGEGAATLRASVDRAFGVARALGERASPASPASLFAVVYAGDEHAAVAGFGNALAREWPETCVKAIRVDAKAPADRLAAQIFDELVGSDTTVEVAYSSGARQIIELLPATASDPRPLRDGAVVAITGGARGLGAKIAQELARRHHARLVLLGRSAGDEESVAAIAAAGGQAIYVPCDVRDPAAVAAALDHGRRRFGPIEAVVHAAGVIADAPLARKDPATIAAVFDTKAFGWLALERATRGDPLQIALALGSWSGRFGNAEQTDYAAANHLVATLAAAWHRTRPSTRVVALDLPPWDGSAMAATIPAGLRAMMRARGVTFLDDASGLAVVHGELVAGGGSGEILVGHDVAIAREDHLRIRLGLDTHPYLGDHRIGGVPVLPLAAAADLACAAAGRLTGARAGLAELELAELELIEGIRLEQDRPIAIDVRARGELRGGALGPIELEISTAGKLAYRARALVSPAPLPEPGGLAPHAPHAPLAPLALPSVLAPPPLALEDFYARHTFHGPRLRGIVRITGLDELHIAGVVRSARAGDLYPSGPKGPGGASGPFGLDPLVVDASFQLAAYFMLVRHGRAGLPLGFDELRVLAPFDPGGAGAPVSCLVRLEAQAGDLVIGHIDYRDGGGRLVAQLRGVRGQFRATERPNTATAPTAVSAAPAGKSNGHAATAAGKPNGSSHGPVEPVRPIPPVLATPAEPARAVPPALATPAEIDPACYDIAAFPEVTALRGRIAEVEASGLDLPYFNLHERVTSDTTVIAGREMINFSAYNYLGLSGHPAVSRAAVVAIERYGTSVSASRIASGEKPLHRELEGELARFLGCEDAIVMVGGHATNVSVVGHLVGPGDLVLHDSLAHDSILGGIKLSGARRRPFPHNDWRALDAALDAMRGAFRRVLIVIEGVYSMDGDIPELPRFIEIKRRHKALLMVDEAHSLGVLGARGAGIGEQFAVDRRDVDIWMGTLSKSLASCGGYVAGSHALVEYLKYTNPGFVYSVGISPPNAAAALAALHELERHPELVDTLRARAALFLALCREREIDTGLSGGSAVVPCIVGDSVRSMLIAQALAQVGINVQPIIYPAVEEHLARLRFFITARHTEAQLRYTANMLAQVNATFNRTPSPRKPASPSTAPLD
jgi:8-amino-7-oxononanoate synthase